MGIEHVNTFVGVMLASSMACVITTLGIFMIGRHARWSERHAVYFKGFAAGMLISISFLHVVPESFEMNGRGPAFLLLGFIGLYLFNYFLRLYNHRHRVESQVNYALALTPLLGIGLHSLIDGMIYSVTFNVDVFTGWAAAIGMILHEFPEGIVSWVILERAGFSRRRSFWYAFLAAALSTPLGALVSHFFVERIEDPTLGVLLALSAGALVYVGASHLLPEVESERRPYALVALLGGVLTGVAIVTLKG